MSPRPRPPLAGFFHVALHTGATAPRLTRHDYRQFLGRLAQAVEGGSLRLLAYCLFATECEFVLGPASPPTVAGFLARVGATRSAPAATGEDTRTGHDAARVQLRTLDSTADLVRVARRVEREALRRGLVGRAQDWPWASLAERLRPTRAVPLVSTPFLASAAWMDYVNARLGPLDDLPQHPRRLATRAQPSQDPVGRRRRADEDEADAHVEGPEHLVLRDVP